MPKELQGVNAPPDILQLFNENRTYFFESDISSLPLPPTTVPAPAQPSHPKLRKSLSQPQLSTTDCVELLASTNLSTAAVPPPEKLLLPTAVMAPTSSQAPLHSQATSYDSGADNSLGNRYQTEPNYRSSRILKSFHSEFRFFGHSRDNRDVQPGSKSVSAPSSPRRASSPELDLETLQSHFESDSRKLSLVKEETAEQVTGSGSMVLVDQPLSKDKEVKPQNLASNAMSLGPTDTVEGKLEGRNMPLTRKMMDWFTTPQKQVKVNRTELNAISPTSF